MVRPPLPPAPGADEHVSLALVNSAVTLPGDQRAEELDSPDTATTWLVERSLAPDDAALLTYCQGQLVGLRTDLRAVFTAHVEGRAPDEVAMDRINRALTRVPSAPLLRHTPQVGLHRAPEHPATQVVEHAMAQIAEDAAELLTGDRAPLVARCDSPPCERFLLRTHGRRQWCSTRCGDRVRAARAYARRQERATLEAR